MPVPADSKFGFVVGETVRVKQDRTSTRIPKAYNGLLCMVEGWTDRLLKLKPIEVPFDPNDRQNYLYADPDKEILYKKHPDVIDIYHVTFADVKAEARGQWHVFYVPTQYFMLHDDLIIGLKIGDFSDTPYGYATAIEWMRWWMKQAEGEEVGEEPKETLANHISSERHIL